MSTKNLVYDHHVSPYKKMLTKFTEYIKGNNFFIKMLFLSIILYYYKTAFWPLTYLFIVCYTITFALFLFYFPWGIKIKHFIIEFLPPVLLALIFAISLVFTEGTIVRIPFKEVLLIGLLFSFFFFLFWNNTYLKQPLPFTLGFYALIGTVGVICVLNILIIIFPGLIPAGIDNFMHINTNLTVSNDNNFFALLILISLVLVNFRDENVKALPVLPSFLKISFNLFFIICIVISGSRRGIISLVILVAACLLYSIFKGISDPQGWDFKGKFKSALFSILLFALFSFSVFFSLSQEKLEDLSYRYFSLFGVTDKNYIDRLIWDPNPESVVRKNTLLDKQSFYLAKGNWKSMLKETVLEDVPTPFGNGIHLKELSNEAGFSLYYCGPKFIYYAYHTYEITFKIKFINGDLNSFRIGWWVDDGDRGYLNTSNLTKYITDIDDGWYFCRSFYTFIDNHADITGFINSVTPGNEFIIADFQLRDLSFNHELPLYAYEIRKTKNLEAYLNNINSPFNDQYNLINNGDFKCGNVFWSSNSDSVQLISEHIDGRNSLLVKKGNGQEGNWSLFYTGRNTYFKNGNEYLLSFEIKPSVKAIIPFFTGFWIDEGNGYLNNLKTKVDTLENGWLRVYTSVVFRKDHEGLVFPINSQIKDTEFYISDIRIHNSTEQQPQIEFDIISADSIKAYADRIDRWMYAKYLWNKEYQWYNKLFGHGFDYLSWYGNKFNYGAPDWPHNPFISILLYSGIIGLLLFIWLLLKVVLIYYKYRKGFSAAFICFLLTFFFSFFSGSSPFDPPIMGFFIMLPFFIHSIHKRADEQNNIKNLTDENTDNRQP